MIRKLLLLLLALGVLLIIGMVTVEDPDWRVMLQLADWGFQINVAVMIALVIGIFAALYLLTRLVRLPVQVTRLLRLRKEARGHDKLARGLLLYLEGRLPSARKHLIAAARHPDCALQAELLLVRCAIKENRLKAASRALDAAQEKSGNVFATSLLRAEILLAEGRIRYALQLLEELKQTQPDNVRVLELLETWSARGNQPEVTLPPDKSA